MSGRSGFDTAAKLNQNIRQSMEGHAAQQTQFNQTLLDSLATLRNTVQAAHTLRTSPNPQMAMSYENITSGPPALTAASSSSVAELKRLGEQLCVV
jgi:hypothetical protein